MIALRRAPGAARACFAGEFGGLELDTVERGRVSDEEKERGNEQ